MTGNTSRLRCEASAAEDRLRSYRLLITAALAAAPQAKEAWQLWTAEFTVDALDSEGYWILPLLYCNLLKAGAEYAERPRLAGVYKQMRLRNAIAQQCLQEVLEGLDQEHCEVIPGPITSLVLCGEEAISLDPAELLVPVSSLEPAHRVLQSCGWRPLLPLPPPQLLPFVPSVRYRHDRGGELVLCWRPFGLDCAVEHDESLWRRSASSQTHTRPLRLADPVDRLLMVVLKGTFPQVCVISHRAIPEISGPTLAGRADELHLAPPWPGLTETSTMAILAGVPDSLMRASLEQIAFSSPPDSKVSLFRLAMRHWQRYRRCPASLRPASFLSCLLQYYRYAWQSGSGIQIASIAMTKVASRFTRPARRISGY